MTTKPNNNDKGGNIATNASIINGDPLNEDPSVRLALNPGDSCRPNSTKTGDGNPSHYWISAVTIYNCLDTPSTGFAGWISSLISILEAAESNTPYRLRREEDDVYSLNLEFAASFNKDISRDFCGAITMSVIDDILFDSPKPMPDWQIRSLVEGIESLRTGGSVPLRLLHELLGIEIEDGGYWFLQLVDAFGMVNLRDVQLWDEKGEIYVGKDFPENFRDYECAFSLEFATKVAMATPTYRGAYFHEYIKEAERAHPPEGV